MAAAGLVAVAAGAIDLASSNSKSVKATLAAATCSLLATAAPAVVDAQEDPGWDFNTAFLFYGESDKRVNDFSLSALARRTYVDDRILSLGLTVDTLTGATPSGAIRQDVPQTFTRPSGNAAYTVPAGKLPLDDTFRDARFALTLNWQQPWGRSNQFNVGFSGSSEYDYTHLGINANFARDFNQRNTTLSFGVAFANDQIDPVGGTPAPLTPMLDVGDRSNRTGSESKNVTDFVIGLSQVMSRNFVAQLNYSYSNTSGYQTDPYKIISLVDGVTGDTIGRTPPPGAQGPSHEFRYESRPDQRTKHSLFAQGKYYLDGKVLDASYRYMTDDWKIDSHTVDLRYRWPMDGGNYLEPHVRFYTQTGAEFYRLSLVDGLPPPQYASADYRLGNFDAVTAGLKYGWKTRNDNDMSVRLEFYRQSGTVPSDQVIGNQAGRDNYADVDAIILQFSYRFAR